MLRARTRGQPAALAALDAMLRGRLPHAILLAGPAGAGKTTLALDLAAALLCQFEDPAERPCRTCRACRMVDGGNHPDLHRLGPGGPGAQIGIGGPDRPRGVRDLVADLALLPVEGGFRVAIVEEAHRLNEDAQSALLKTLEEPPAGVVLILCAEEEERLLPTIRSRCARIRLGPVPVRELEAWLAEVDAAEAPRAARLARISGGRPGLALAYARQPEAEAARAEMGRLLLDLLDARSAAALGAVRNLIARALDLARALDRGVGPDAGPSAGAGTGRRATRARPAPMAGTAAPVPERSSDQALQASSGDDAEPAAGGNRAVAPQERRRAAIALVQVWQDVARDLALVGLGEAARIRDLGLLDELQPAAAAMAPERRRHLGAFLADLQRATELLDGNVSPELVIDVLVLRWRSPAAGPSEEAMAGRVLATGLP